MGWLKFRRGACKAVYFHPACLTYIQICCCCCSVTKLCPTIVTPWTAASQASLTFTTSQSWLYSCPLNWWCYPIISSSVALFSSFSQSFPASGSFQWGRLFTSGSQYIGPPAPASVLPMNIQHWFSLGLTGLILLSKGLSRVFSSTTIWKHQFFSSQPPLWYKSHTCTWPLEKP